MKKICFFTNSMFKIGGEQRITTLIANELIKNMEEENIKSLEWMDINSDIENLLLYQKYALSKYLESEDNKFTTYGWK